MVKTQVQIPDDLYAEAKRISREYEMSFAEVVRRGLEKVSPLYPPKQRKVKSVLPAPCSLGWKGLTHEEIKEHAQMTSVEMEIREKGID